jgi:5-carboxymethyl-2-hydroxymuconate isomerase
MPFEKGRSKTGRRKKGTSNKVTESLKEKVRDLTEDLYLDVLEDVKELEPKDRIHFFVKLLPYVMPKQSIELGQK